MDYLILAGIFVLVFGLVLSGFMMLNRRRALLQQRLQTGTGADAVSGEHALLLGDLTPALAAQIPMGAEDRGDLQRELRIAGYYRPTALLEYAALRTVLTIAPVVAAGVIALFTETQQYAMWVWISGIILAMLGFSLPRLFVHYRGKARMGEIEKGLPIAIDMLILCLSAGLNVLNSLQRVVKELHGAFPVLGYEFEIVRRQAELRTLEFALAQFADRTGLINVRNLAVILSHSENLGTDAVATLKEYADSLRTNMRQRADEMANKAPFKMLFPAYLMAIGAAILIISPTVLEFRSFRRENLLGNVNTESRDNMNQPATVAPPPRQPNLDQELQ